MSATIAHSRWSSASLPVRHSDLIWELSAVAGCPFRPSSPSTDAAWPPPPPPTNATSKKMTTPMIPTPPPPSARPCRRACRRVPRPDRRDRRHWHPHRRRAGPRPATCPAGHRRCSPWSPPAMRPDHHAARAGRVPWSAWWSALRGDVASHDATAVPISRSLNMITATQVELRAGARILLEPTTMRVQPGDRIGLVGRNGAGKTSTLRTFAGETAPARGPYRADQPGRIPAAGPAHRRPQRPRPRPGPVRARVGHAGDRHREGPAAAGRAPRRRHACCAATGRSRTASPPSAATRPRAKPHGSAPIWACRSGCCSSRCAPCPVASGAGSSWPASCSPIPAPNRPRCCSTSRPTTSTPTPSSGCAISCASTPAAWC